MCTLSFLYLWSLFFVVSTLSFIVVCVSWEKGVGVIRECGKWSKWRDWEKKKVSFRESGEWVICDGCVSDLICQISFHLFFFSDFNLPHFYIVFFPLRLIRLNKNSLGPNITFVIYLFSLNENENKLLNIFLFFIKKKQICYF